MSALIAIGMIVAAQAGQATPVKQLPKPKFVDSKARKTWEAGVNAYGRLKHVSMTVRTGPTVDKVVISGTRASESQPGLRWAYDGKRLTLIDGGKPKHFKIKPGDIPSKVGPAIDPLLQAWALHRNPARMLAPTGTTVRDVGMVSVGGVICDALELTRADGRLTVLVRRSDHLFARITSKNLDLHSRVVSGVDREFRYLSVGKPVPASAFRFR